MLDSVGQTIAQAVRRFSTPIDMHSPKSTGEEIASAALADYVKEQNVQLGIEQGSVVIVDSETSQILDKRPKNETYMQLMGATKSDHRFKRKLFNENLRSARQHITFSLIAASLGFLIVLGGVVAMMLGYSQAGIVTSAAGIVSELVSVLFFNQAKHFGQHLDSTLNRLLEIEGFFRAFAIAEQIPNVELRDHLFEAIVMRMLGIEPDEHHASEHNKDADSKN